MSTYTEEKDARKFDVAAALDAGAAIGEPRFVEDAYAYTVIPDGFKLESLEQFETTPYRKRGVITTDDAPSFILYCNKHSDASSMIYASIDSENSRFNLTAVLDDHEEGRDARWREHLCKLTPKTSVEWRRWTIKNKQAMTQADFATWLEDNLGDIASVADMPSGADMLQMALGFERTADKRLKSRINLQSGGVRFEYVEDEDKDTRASMEVFQRFFLGIPVFDGDGAAYPIEVRLKYREKDAKVSFWYELIRPDRVFKHAVTDALAVISSGTMLTIVRGDAGV